MNEERKTKSWTYKDVNWTK